MLILTLALTVWLVGAVLATPSQLRRRMEREVCGSCQKPSDHEWHRYTYSYHKYSGKPRGELRARTIGDAWVSFAAMLGWPVVAMVYGGYGAGWLVSRALGKPVLKFSRLTAPELRRIEREQAERIRKNEQEIQRLTDEINGTPERTPEVILTEARREVARLRPALTRNDYEEYLARRETRNNG